MSKRTIHAFVLAATVFFAHAAQAEGADDLTAVATQGGQTLTFHDIDQAVEKVPEIDRVGFISSPKRIQALVLNLLLQKQLAADALKAGIPQTPEIEAATDLAKTQLLAKAQLEHFQSSLKIPDLSALAHEEYIAHKEKYLAPASFDVQQVFISIGSRTNAQAKAVADEVEQQAKSGNADFDALVAKYSDEPNKAQTLGIIKHAGKRAIQSDLASAVDALLMPGSISPPVETASGYYVLKLLVRTPERQLSFDEAREQILDALKSAYVKKTVADYVDTLRNNPLDADPDKINSLRTRYGTLPALPVSAKPAPDAPAIGAQAAKQH
ncbi:peptidylprolyl isomerase [Dokdonella sp.]|uniref:peptidylprolyl isomerase n=1 Tax=Dokdonella sp. TaxID=2291710 RepID=UPI0025BC1135|nr:peptidylprolyl isomerase [Dokdonella sp.]MBX3689852.1 peptidyl-prolyl cis-trans isomerase [Dokdonella sp.]